MGALVEELLEAGHEVQWLVAPIDLDHPEVAKLRQRGADVQKLPDPLPSYVRWKGLRRKLYTLFRGERSLAEAIQAFSPDHIFVNQGGTWCALEPDLYELLSSYSGRYSLICHLGRPNGYPKEIKRDLGTKLAEGALKIYFPSKWVHELAEEQAGKKFRNSQLFHYPHRFRFDQPLPWPQNSLPRLALVSRLDADHKGIDLALTALARLKKEGLDFLFTLHGSGPDEAALRGMVANLGLAKELSFAGYAEDVRKVWQENEILLLPSRREGCAVAMTEAMGFGRPVIATAVGGAPDWIEPGKEGFLCAAPEAELLAETLRSALQERLRWREMGLAAHQKIKERLPARPARLFLESLA